MSFQDKIALVTGGSSGIGLAIAKELATQGATVIVTGRQQAKLDAAVAEIGNGATGVQTDVSSVAALDALMSEIQYKHGKLDVLIANAGYGNIAALDAITEEDFDGVFGTNVKGVVFTVQKSLPLMPDGGAVVIIGSTASMDPGPGLSVYGASKAALRNFVRSWIQDIKGSGIRINILSPGPVRTQSLIDMFPPGSADAVIAHLSDKSMIGRIGEPEEIGRAVAFLASDAASYVNGVELFADGGASQV